MTADDLNFDRAESTDGAGSTGSIVCANCGKPISGSYYTANSAPICPSCRGRLETAAKPVGASGVILKALVFGFGAAIVGAIIYWAVMKFLNLEIGIVAILTGWLVGRAMGVATQGRGGRLLQVAAALLVYVSVAMAYFPFVLEQARTDVETAVAVDSAAVVATIDSMAPATAPATEPLETEVPVENAASTNPVIAIAMLLGLALALPILVIVGSMPGGVISAAIIGFGMVQAWNMTAAPKLVFEGPFKTGDGSAGAT